MSWVDLKYAEKRVPESFLAVSRNFKSESKDFFSYFDQCSEDNRLTERCLWPSVQKAAYSSSIIDACHMATLAHAVTNNFFVPQALRSQMQKQRSWWLLRRSYSTSQTRKTFMSNLLCSTPQRQVTIRPRFSVFGHTLLCRCSIYIPLCPDRVTSTPPTQQEVMWSRWAPNSFLLHQLLCPLWRRWLQLSRVWLYLNEHVQESLEIKKIQY